MIKATEYLFRNCLEKTAGVSLRIDEYLSYCGEVSELLKNQTASQNVSTQDADGKDADSYVSTIGSSDAVMPSENYNDILKEIQKTKAEAGQSQSYSENTGQTSGQTTQASGTGAAGNTGGGGDSDDETTITKTVVINGVTYLETTTVENGVKSVQRTAISGVGEE
ncbi:hypothetical protein DW927_16115 [Roseburia intestinalis]|uniref:Uncharacterized protein n=1 Tax=Roseburia intestinalis TaxID=166486 RepID=A0A3R6AES2_9FIRM|nr:hypothetical protein DW927_16115 [Roseburia intestinalis]